MFARSRSRLTRFHPRETAFRIRLCPIGEDVSPNATPPSRSRRIFCLFEDNRFILPSYNSKTINVYRFAIVSLYTSVYFIIHNHILIRKPCCHYQVTLSICIRMMGTVDGTAKLKDGDRIRVDGTNGQVALVSGRGESNPHLVLGKDV